MPDHDVFAKHALIVDVLRVMHALAPDGLPPSQEDNVRAMLDAYLPGPRQGDLFDEKPFREGDRLVKAAMGMVFGGPERHDASLALAVKVAITVGHVRAGRWERLQATEAMAIAKVLGVDMPGEGAGGTTPPAAGVSDPPDGIPVEFLFSWQPSDARKVGRLGTSTAYAGLVETDPIDAPVACSLWTPEGRLTLRRLGDTWLRPVLSPGSWRPISVAGFREAARSGCAWSDNPFLPCPRRGLPSFHLLDLAGPQPLTAANARRMSDARDPCLVRAGQLHVIDGVVHRPAGAPLAGIATTYHGHSPVVGPAWCVDDFDSTRSMGTFGDVPMATWFNGEPTPDRSGGVDPDGCFVTLSDWIGVSRHLETHVRGIRGTPAPFPPSIGDLAWSSDPPPSAPDIRRCVRVASGLAARLLPLSHVSYGPGSRSDARVRLRDVLSDLTSDRDDGQSGDASLSKVIDALCAEVLGLDWPAADPRSHLWAYVAALASYAVHRASCPQEVDPDLATVRF